MTLPDGTQHMLSCESSADVGLWTEHRPPGPSRRPGRWPVVLAACGLLWGLIGASASSQAAAQVVQHGATTSIAGGEAGSSTFSVAASIGQSLPPGRAESSSFSLSGGFLTEDEAEEVDTQAPVISPIAIPPSEAGQDVVVEVPITDDSAVDMAALHFRRGGDGDFTTVAMNAADGSFAATVPGGDVTPDGIEYFVTAEDGAGNSARAPEAGVYALSVTVAGDGLVRGQQQPAGNAQSAYRIVSWPLELEDNAASTVLQRDLGATDDTRWRFFELRPPSDGTQNVREGPSGITIDPGQGYWLIVAEAATLSTGAATSIRTDEPFRIPLHEGWNFVANPFSFPIPFANVTAENGKALDFRTFTGEWQSFSGAMQPFQGYAVITEDQGDDVLLIDPVLSPAPSKASPEEDASDPPYAWSLGITATSPTARDADNVAAVADGASLTFDALDRPEPPAIGEFVSLSFSRADWGTPLRDYAVDVQPEGEEGYLWPFVIRSGRMEAVDLRVMSVDQVPSEFRVVLVDEALKTRRDLREDPSYAFTTGGPDAERAFNLLVGTDEFVADKMQELVPAAFELSQNFPNPFADVTTIRYGLEENAVVTLTIFDLLGREVATLSGGEDREAGYHAVVWDGRDAGGAAVASGIYFYVLEAGDRTASGKMSLVR